MFCLSSMLIVTTIEGIETMFCLSSMLIVTTSEGIETMFCLSSMLIIFTKLFHKLWIKKFKNDWTKTLQKIPRKTNVSLSSAKRKLAEKNE